MEQKKKLAYFLSHPIQYFSPLLKEMAKEFDLHVYYFSDANLKGVVDKEFGRVITWDVPLLDGYKYTFIKNNSSKPGLSNGFFQLVNWGLINYLRKDASPIVIVNGWGYFSSILTVVTGKILGKKIWMRAENPLSQELQKSKKLLFLKRLMLRHFLFRFVNRFLYIGTESKAFFEYYGARPDQLVYTPYSVDNFFFDAQYEKLKNSVPLLKEQLGLPPGKKIILFSGKYIDKKRPLDLITAFKELSDPALVLVMVGEGELRNEMETYIAKNNLTGVYLTGFVNQSQISAYYMVADVFVMCSGAGETWGLSVNEAMNFAKPVVVTDTSGCSSDLVEPSRNGFIVEEGNIHQLADALNRLLQDKSFRIQAGNLSKAKIREYSIATIVKNLKAAAV